MLNRRSKQIDPFLMIKAHIFVQNKRNLVADSFLSCEQNVNKNYATDLLRADWLYAAQLGQLRRRVLK